MNYRYKCSECGEQRVVKMTITEYVNSPINVLCYHPVDSGDGYSVIMDRLYSPVKVQFRGKGFTGAGGTISHMDKNERVKDLAEKTDAEGI